MSAIIVNTNSAYADIWPMFFGQLDKYFPVKRYIFSDVDCPHGETILYDPSSKFRSQYLSCISQVKEDVVLNMNDDYVLYEPVATDILRKLWVEVNEGYFDFIRLTRGDNFGPNIYEYLYGLDINKPFYYSQTVAIWKRETLERIHNLGPDYHIAGKQGPSFEEAANDICRTLGVRGAVYYDGAPKRGMAHYDCKIFPYVASALVRGKWNISEYKELLPLLEEYGVDPGIRGVV